MTTHRTTWAGLAALAALGLVAGCSSATAGDASGTSVSATDAATVSAAGSADELLATLAEPHTPDDVDASSAIDIELDGTGATTTADGVSVADGTVTITAAGTYRLTGPLDGQVVVAAPDDAHVTLILDDVAISSSTTSAIAITSADEATVQLAGGSRSTLSDGDSYGEADGEPNAALHSRADLTITGDGELDVTGNANDGISSTDGLSSGTLR
jgi:hypothetical protein